MRMKIRTEEQEGRNWRRTGRGDRQNSSMGVVQADSATVGSGQITTLWSHLKVLSF
jgi:hypothetical protein